MFDDEDDLPTILITGVSKNSENFCMPSADVLASQRAREEECKQELQELGSKIKNISSRNVHLSRQTSNSDIDVSLTAAVNALCMEKPVYYSASAPSTILHALISSNALKPYDLTLLNHCVHLLETKDEQLIAKTLQEMILDTRQCIKKRNQSDTFLPDEDAIVLCCWLCAMSLWSAPRPGGMPQILREILKMAGPAVEVTVGAAISEALPEPRRLVEASDVVFGPSPVQRRLSDKFLVTALNVLAVSDRPNTSLILSTVCKHIKRAWCGLDTDTKLTAILLVGRVAARPEVDPEGLEALQNLLVYIKQTPAQTMQQTPETLQILVAASKLQILFEVI